MPGTCALNCRSTDAHFFEQSVAVELLQVCRTGKCGSHLNSHTPDLSCRIKRKGSWPFSMCNGIRANWPSTFSTWENDGYTMHCANGVVALAQTCPFRQQHTHVFRHKQFWRCAGRCLAQIRHIRSQCHLQTMPTWAVPPSWLSLAVHVEHRALGPSIFLSVPDWKVPCQSNATARSWRNLPILIFWDQRTV